MTTKIKDNESKARLQGHLRIEVFDNAKDMNKISESECKNLITDEGLDALLDIMLHGATQITTWYCVISESDTSPAAGMTYAVPSFTETTAYDESTRPAFNEAASSSQSVTNSANKATFTMNATKTLYGAGLVGGGTDGNTKDDQAGGGTLFNYGEFTASQPVISGNVVNLTITISAADDGV
ncbi:MAG: hypothetical protein PVI90_16650 [Desulfobacteraceae bacterium]|jgi:hypothetical protein